MSPCVFCGVQKAHALSVDCRVEPVNLCEALLSGKYCAILTASSGLLIQMRAGGSGLSTTNRSADSTRQRNELGEFHPWHPITEGLSRSSVKDSLDLSQFTSRVQIQVCSSGKILV